MDRKTGELIEQFVNANIDEFHARRVERLSDLKLSSILPNKNPYLFRAKSLNQGAELVTALLDALLSSSEEGSFGSFLERLAIFVPENTGGGTKSAAEGVDLEMTREGIRYLIAVKSGKNWGNAGQHKKLRENFRNAVRVIRQTDNRSRLQPTLGICYGKFRTANNGEFLHVGGQSFWHLISGDENLYIDLIGPLGFKSEEHARKFGEERDSTYRRLIQKFLDAYCDGKGAVDWSKLVTFMSGNLGAPPLKRNTPRKSP